MTHQPINFHPMAQNVLDYVGRTDLVTGNGRPVRIAKRMSGGGFDVTIGDQRYQDVSNLEACGLLWQHETGLRS